MMFGDTCVVTVAGSGEKGCSDGKLLSATFNGPSSVAPLGSEVVLVSDTANSALRILDFATGTVSTLDTSTLEGCTATVAQPRSLCAVTVNSINGILAADAGHNRLLFINGETGCVELLAGTGEPAHLDGELTAAMFHEPSCAACAQGSSLVYISDTKNHCIRVLNLMTRRAKTLAGMPGISGYQDGTNARFNEPLGLVLTEDGNVIVCDSKNGALRYVSRQDGEVVTLVGKPGKSLFKAHCTYGYKNSMVNQRYLSRRRADSGNYSSFRFECPHSIVAVNDGLLVTDIAAGKLAFVDSQYETVKYLNTYAPGPGLINGALPQARFVAPAGICVHSNGVLVADSGANCIRFITSMARPGSACHMTSDATKPSELPKRKNGESSMPGNGANACSFTTSVMSKFAQQSLNSNILSSSFTGHLSQLGDGTARSGTRNASLDDMVALADPSTLKYTLEKGGLTDNDLPDSSPATASYVRDIFDEPHPSNMLNMEVYDLLLTHFLTSGTLQQVGKTPRKMAADKQSPARVASNLSMSTKVTNKKSTTSTATTQSMQHSGTSITLAVNGSSYLLKTVIEVCTVIASRIFDSSQETYGVYGKRTAKYIRTFNPLLYVPKISLGGIDVSILEGTKRGILRALAMATNLPSFSSNLLSDDGLRAEYSIHHASQGARTFVIEPRTASFVLELSVSFLVDSLFMRCFNTVELVFYSSPPKQTDTTQEDLQSQQTMDTGPEDSKTQKDTVNVLSGCPAGKTGNRLKTVQINNSVLNDASRYSIDVHSDNEDGSSDLTDLTELDATLFTFYNAFPNQADDLVEITSHSVNTSTFTNATSGVFDYSPHHSIGECTIKLPVKLSGRSEERSSFISPVTPETFKARYGVPNAGEGLCHEIVLHLHITGQRIVEKLASSTDALLDKIVLCEYAQIKIPFMVMRSMQTYKQIIHKISELQEVSTLPRDVGRLEKNVIMGVCNASAPLALLGKELKEKLKGL